MRTCASQTYVNQRVESIEPQVKLCQGVTTAGYYPFVGYGSPYVVRFASECLYSVSPYIKCKLSMEDTMLG